MKKSGDLTVVEIVAIITITVLAVFALRLQYKRKRAGGDFNHCQSNLKSIGTELEMYSTDHNGKYPKKMVFLTPNYLVEIPACPSTTSSKGYINSYRVSEKGINYSFYCAGLNHKFVGVPGNYPLYNSWNGLQAKP